MPNRSREVDRFIEGLDHPLKDGIERLRAGRCGLTLTPRFPLPGQDEGTAAPPPLRVRDSAP